MKKEQKYEYLFSKYPAVISKEQLCQMCHVSKRVAKNLLDHGLIPCQTTGKRTHSYKIKLRDAVKYLYNRELHPEKYRASISWCTGRPTQEGFWLSPENAEKLQVFFNRISSDWPDALTVIQACHYIGYSKETINGWIRGRKLSAIKIGRVNYIAKEVLLQFMSSPAYQLISVKSTGHLEQLRRAYHEGL